MHKVILYNHSGILKIEKWTSVQDYCIIVKPHGSCNHLPLQCSENFQFGIIIFSCHVPLISVAWTSITIQLFYRTALGLSLCDVSLWGLCIMAGMSQRQCWSSHVFSQRVWSSSLYHWWWGSPGLPPKNYLLESSTLLLLQREILLNSIYVDILPSIRHSQSFIGIDLWYNLILSLFIMFTFSQQECLQPGFCVLLTCLHYSLTLDFLAQRDAPGSSCPFLAPPSSGISHVS